MKHKTPLALLALTAAAFPATVHAAGPWTVANPQGITWTAPTGCTLVLDLTTSDGYPTRVDTTQLHELVVVRRNGVEIGRTLDLADRVPLAVSTKRITTPVAAGDTVTVVHSSKAGLADGTANSVIVDATFTCQPAPTTTVPVTTTPNLTPPLTTVVDPPDLTPPLTTVVDPPLPSPSSTTTTTVAVGEPPTVITTPRPPVSTTTVPPYVLPETGTSDLLIWLGLLAGTYCALGALLIWLNGGKR